MNKPKNVIFLDYKLNKPSPVKFLTSAPPFSTEFITTHNIHLLHRLKALHDDKAHLQVTLSAVVKAIGFTGAEFASWGACNAFVPTSAC